MSQGGRAKNAARDPSGKSAARDPPAKGGAPGKGEATSKTAPVAVHGAPEPRAAKAPSGKAAAAAAGMTLADRPALCAAVAKFINDNANFESSAAVDRVLDVMETHTTLKEIFETPLRERIIGFDSALRWCLFLSLGPAEAENAGDVAFADTFDALEAFDMLNAVYDLAVREAVWSAFDEDDDDEDEDDEDDEGADPDDADVNILAN